MSGDHFGRPLYVQMAALLAIHGERPTTAEGLTRALLNHERRYWQGLLKGTALTAPARRAQLLLALATLAGGFRTIGSAGAYWSAVNCDSRDANDLDVLFHALVPLYPGKQGLQAVRPDLLGEALVSQTLLGMEADELLDAVLSDSASQPVRRHALTVLARLSGQQPDLYETLIEALSRHFRHCHDDILSVAVETGGGLSVLAEAAFKRLPLAAKSQLAGLLEPKLKEESVQLAGLACAISGFLVENAGRKFRQRKKRIKSKVEYAGALLNYSVNLHRVGQDEQALMSAQKGLTLFQQLYGKNKKRFAQDYAMSLNNVGNRLSDAGEYKEALDHAKKSLAIRKRLSEQNPDRYESDYAMSLNNVGKHLSDASEYKEALTHARKSLAIYKRLSEQNPDRYETNSFSSKCHTIFLAWLEGSADKGNVQEDLPPFPKTVLQHKIPELKVYKNFVEACCFSGESKRILLFCQILVDWETLLVADQNNNIEYWLCVTAWCATFSPQRVEHVDWLEDWRQFKKQCHGAIPAWMEKTAEKLLFQWPE